MSLRIVVTAALASASLLGCATVFNQPVNVPAADGITDRLRLNFEDVAADDAVLVGLSFSGGGTRAAAFSFGVLSELERIPVRGAAAPMIDRLDFISGVSGGSVTAAYYGLKKREGLRDFRERFLLRNAEESLTTNVSLVNIAKAFGGGVNDASGFTKWLDANLFGGATFGQFRAVGRPRVWINASDIYSRTPFVFGATAFTAMCSDIDQYPLAEAVAASAAVPLAFAPIVIKTYPRACNDPLPPWILRAKDDRNAPPLLRSFAQAIARYHDGAMPYIKLLDGGLVDNYGLAGFTIARLSSDTPYGPLNPKQAVKMRRAMFLVVDAKGGLTGRSWVDSVEGPAGVDLVMAAVDTTIDASVQSSFTAFQSTMADWQSALIRWRCGLSASQRAQYGVGPGWNCRDIKFFIGRIGFDQLDPDRAARLEAVPTRFQLPPQQVDDVIEAGRDALRASPVFKAFAASF
jgi:NTE family protein